MGNESIKTELDGNDLLLRNFEKLGVTLDDLENKDTLELFDQLLARMRQFPGVISEAQIADILDTEGLRLIRRIVPEFASFADILERARAGGAILDASTLKRMEDAARTLREFSDQLTLEFAPILGDFIKQLIPFLPALTAAMKELAAAIVAGLSFFRSLPARVKSVTDAVSP